MKKGYTSFLWFLCIGLLAGTAFLVFSLFIYWSLLKEADHHLLLAVYSLRTPQWTAIFMFIQQLGSKYTLLPMMAAAAIYLLLFRRVYESIFLMSTVWGAYIINGLLKNLFHQLRPSFGMLLMENSFGYPSRHTMLVIAFFGGISVLIWTNIKMSRSLLKGLTVLTSAIILLVGFSMVYLGAHFPSDIVGGLLAGTSWLFLCGAWYQKCREIRAYRQ
ncbi:undecaprenyl-diphosphatase [Fictibacillus solisalsi]|uniref:Undecaprenyl-diphosphatase n=1 Tax=Fictibacillus solisalsi TaxID=459525 RepID=A0A1H0ABA5_9BACL|nr:phosphatase PAP2 family protein [Fictibacillus solisalsi]SDN30869.1 undecaprenyl-diphosphatase [Fictibacillus solisalsi]